MDKWGLVFAGGGGKGAYEIGAWKALEESGIRFDAVSGTSVGALNAALYATQSLGQAEKIWLNYVNKKTILEPRGKSGKNIEHELKQWIYRNENGNSIHKYKRETGFGNFSDLINRRLSEGAFSRNALEIIIKETLIPQKIRTSKIACYATCCNMMNKIKPHGKFTEYFLLNNYDEKTITNILLASSAIPLVFEPVRINKKNGYFDGGVLGVGNNVPIGVLYHREKCNKIVVIHLDCSKKYKNFVRHGMESVKKELDKICSPNYRKAKIYHIYPYEDVGGFFDGTLSFHPNAVAKNIDIGYRSVKHYIKKYKLFQ